MTMKRPSALVTRLHGKLPTSTCARADEAIRLPVTSVDDVVDVRREEFV
jgi:hypothetical protein